MPPEEENGENAGNEEPKLQFSYVECLLFSFHQLGKKLPDFLIDKVNAEKLKDFKIRFVFLPWLPVSLFCVLSPVNFIPVIESTGCSTLHEDCKCISANSVWLCKAKLVML